MRYSVVGAPALGFDLTRLRGGRQVAAVLRAAQRAAPEDLERLAARHPGDDVRAGWRRACARAEADTETLSDVLPLAGEALEAAALGETALLRRLETSLLGDLHALDGLVRRDLLDWTWLHSGAMAVQDPTASQAADVLVDAALGGYLRDRLSQDVRRAMAAPFLGSGLAARDEPAPTGVDRVDRMLAVLAAADPVGRQRWRRVVDDLRVHTAQWAPAMHQATWALSLAERLRLGCDVQLAGVIAFRDGGFSAHDAAYGVWNAVAGALQATVVGDLLPTDEAGVLLRPWRVVYGEGGAAPDAREAHA